MKQFELVFAFIVLTMMTLFTIAMIKTFNEVDIKNDVVIPIIRHSAGVK